MLEKNVFICKINSTQYFYAQNYDYAYFTSLFILYLAEGKII